MVKRVTLHTVIKVIGTTITPVSSWPLPANASRRSILLHEINWCIVMMYHTFNVLCTFIDFCRSLSNNIEHAVAICADVSGSLMVVTTVFICRKERRRVRDMLDDLDSFMKRANQEESDLLQSYVDKCAPFHAGIMFSCVAGPLVYILGPLVTSEVKPLDLEYPFPVESTWLFRVIYFVEAMTVMQVGSTATVDFLFATLLWYTGGRVQMLATELGRATNHNDVKRCIRQHQRMLEFIEQLKRPVRLITTVAMALALTSIIASGLVLMRKPPMLLVMKYTALGLVAVMRLFVFSWPADNLMNTSQRIAVEAFNCKWVGKSPGMTKDLLFIMHKAQTPVVIALPGITDALNLQFYTSVMKAIFSYITTLNAMLNS